MTCPSCNRSTRDYTNSSGLVTRCDDAWHTTGIHCPVYGLHGCKHEGSGCVGMICVEWGKTPVSGAAKALPDASKDSHSPATPEDFVRPEPTQKPWIECPCGTKKRNEWGFDPHSRCAGCGRPDPRTLPRTASWPFQEDPRPLEPAQNGFIHCANCESVQPAAGHECRDPDAKHEAILSYRDRAEFAEDLLNRLAFVHGCEHMGLYDLEPVDLDREPTRSNLARGGWVWAFCDAGECPFCDAARGGGR